MDTLIFTLYVFPAFMSINYFIIIKIEDISRKEKTFSKDKLKLYQVILLCCVPILNLVIFYYCIGNTFFNKNKKGGNKK
jgi:hypothetical protein